MVSFSVMNDKNFTHRCVAADMIFEMLDALLNIPLSLNVSLQDLGKNYHYLPLFL